MSLLAAVMAGVFVGSVLFAFDYGKGASYLSNDPAACANCHIMGPQFVSWERASHRNVAVCNDCHLPQHGLAKWISKAENGFRHSAAFTLQNFAEPIVMTAGNRKTLQRNCVECHEGLTHTMADASGRPLVESVDCVHCHRDAGHGERTALGGPDPTLAKTPPGVHP